MSEVSAPSDAGMSHLGSLFFPPKKVIRTWQGALVLGLVNLPHVWKKVHPLPLFDSEARYARSIWGFS